MYDPVLAQQEKAPEPQDKTAELMASRDAFKQSARKIRKDFGIKSTVKDVGKAGANDAKPKSIFNAFKKALKK